MEIETIPIIHDTAAPAPFFLCSLCEKPFNQEVSRNRHVKYCGARKRRRLRSCLACSGAKTKCNFEAPCMRCIKKSIDCVYKDVSFGQRQHRMKSFPKGNTEAATPSTGAAYHDNNDGIHLRVENARASAVVDRIFPHAQEIRDSGTFDLDCFSPSKVGAQISAFEDGFIFDELFALDDASGQQKHPEAREINKNSQVNGSLAHWCMWMTRRDASLLVVAENSAVEPDLDGLAALQVIRPHAQQNAELIIQSLRSLPFRMQRRETFPWFIHLQPPFREMPGASVLPEPLSTCMSISQLFASRTSETKPFLWRTIRTECRSFVSEMLSLSPHEILAAIQACMIYLIMYIVDYVPEYEGYGQELLMTLNDLYCLFKKTTTEISNSGQHSSTRSAWESWIFEESQRRLAILWFLFGCVVYVKNGRTYDESQSYRSIILPSPKSIWEATTEVAWEREYEATRIWHPNSLSTLGDLMDAQRSSNVQSNARKLDMWNAGVDNVGSLLNLVGSML